jgi:ligand-binding sensor domain-containing protein
MHKPDDSTSISDDRIYGIGEDALHQIWAGTLGCGVNILDNKTGKFKILTTRNSALCFDMIPSVYRDKYDMLWLTTEYGLSAYDYRNNSFRTFQNQENDSNSISDNNVINCFQEAMAPSGILLSGTDCPLTVCTVL